MIERDCPRVTEPRALGAQFSTRPDPRRLVAVLILLAVALAAPPLAQAQRESSEELAKELQNPVADLISVPFQSN